MEQPQTTNQDEKHQAPALRHAALSDIGRARTDNQDAFAIHADLNLFMVSDGMGGAHAGSLASGIVVQVLPQLLRKELATVRKGSSHAVSALLRRSVSMLSQEMYTKSVGQPGLSGMGATVVAALLRPGKVHIAHMGDSRAYLFRNGTLRQLTEDHSLVALLLRSGDITHEEAKSHPARAQLTRFVGMQSALPPRVRTVRTRPGDRLLLCTDGLTTMLTDSNITEILTREPDPDAACRALVDAANAAGGKDNITVTLISPPC